MSPPLATSSAVKKVCVTKVQPSTESPVPCGDSFFDDVSAYTQSHMTYMRGFKAPSGTSPVGGTAPVQRLDSFSAMSDEEDIGTLGDPQCMESSASVTTPGAHVDTFRNAGSVGKSGLPTESPIELSQESCFSSLIEGGDFEYDTAKTVKSIPVLDKPSSSKKPAAAKSGNCTSDFHVSDDMFDNFVDEFDDGGGFDFDEADLAAAEAEGQASASSSSTDQASGVDGKLRSNQVFCYTVEWASMGSFLESAMC